MVSLLQSPWPLTIPPHVRPLAEGASRTGAGHHGSTAFSAGMKVWDRRDEQEDGERLPSSYPCSPKIPHALEPKFQGSLAEA